MHKTTSDSVGLPIESNQYSKREKRKRKNGGGSGASSSSQDGSSAISILSGEHKQKQLRRHGNVNKPSNEVGTDDNAAVSSDTFTEPQIAQLTHLIRAVNGTTAPTTQSATHPTTKSSKSRSRDTSSKTKRKNGKCSLLPGEIQITSNNAGESSSAESKGRHCQQLIFQPSCQILWILQFFLNLSQNFVNKWQHLTQIKFTKIEKIKNTKLNSTKQRPEI